jgi:hypothetical protein
MEKSIIKIYHIGGMSCGGLNNFRTSRSEKKLNHSNIH